MFLVLAHPVNLNQFVLLLQPMNRLPDVHSSPVNTMAERQDLAVDHSQLLATADSDRVASEEPETSDVTSVPVTSTFMSADGFNHIGSTEHLRIPAAEFSMDEGAVAAALNDTSELSEELEPQLDAARALGTDVSDQIDRSEESKLQSLEDMEQLENVQVAIKVFIPLRLPICSILLRFGLHVCMHEMLL